MVKGQIVFISKKFILLNINQNVVKVKIENKASYFLTIIVISMNAKNNDNYFLSMVSHINWDSYKLSLEYNKIS